MAHKPKMKTTTIISPSRAGERQNSQQPLSGGTYSWIHACVNEKLCEKSAGYSVTMGQCQNLTAGNVIARTPLLNCDRLFFLTKNKVVSWSWTTSMPDSCLFSDMIPGRIVIK